MSADIGDHHQTKEIRYNTIVIRLQNYSKMNFIAMQEKRIPVF